MEVASGNEHNTLWIGNVIVKRSAPRGQRRLLGVGDGTGVARGTLAMVHNTFVTRHPEDFFLFSHPSATTDLLLFNNIFSGPGLRADSPCRDAGVSERCHLSRPKGDIE